MAKKKQPQPPLVTPSSAKEPSEVASASKKPSEVASPVKKRSELASTSSRKKLPEPLQNPSPESGSESEESGSESEGEEDETPKNQETASAPVVANEISGSETESVSDSESEPTPAAAAAVASPLNKKRQSPRGVVSTEANPSKRAKTESGSETAAKKAMFERIWSEEDEILLLQGMIDYRSKTGKNASDDTNGFFNSIKSSFSFEVKSLHQFTTKIRSLKKKYVKKMNNGGEASITKRHDLMCLARAKQIWGTTDVDVVDSTTPVVKSNKKKEDDQLNRVKDDDDSLTMLDDADWFRKTFILGAIRSFGAVMVDEEALKAKWRLVPVKKKKGIEEKCKSLEAEEMKCFLLKVEILSEVSSALAKSD